MLHEYRSCRLWGIPRRERFQRAIRTPFVQWMRRYPDVCWADLVQWWVFPTVHPFHEIFEIRGTAGNCGRMGLEPYCGKCASHNVDTWR